MTSPAVTKAVICVFDGLRPDRVSADLTPHLWRFATGGTWFCESRSVFPSVTRVATTSFATGSKPATHGIMNNSFYHPAVIKDRLLDTSSAADLRAAEAHHGGRFVEADGLGCVLAKAGKSYSVVHTGSTGSAYLVNHRAKKHGHWTFSIHGADHTQTPDAVKEVAERFGPLSKRGLPKFAEVDYGADVFVDHVLFNRRPDVALIWFCEPDTSYHFCEIGAQDTVDVTKRTDEQFGRILETIASMPDADETLVVAMSDHGQIATTNHVDLQSILQEIGVRASHQPDDNLDAITTLGIGVDITLVEKDRQRLETIAHALMEHPSTGLLFTPSRSPEAGVIDGTLPYSAVGIDHPRAADLIYVPHSSIEPDQHGLPGNASCVIPIDVPLGGGMHGGLNPYEQNTMLAFGGTAPALGLINDPADLTDIVPTILELLGISAPSSMTGKPLAAMTGSQRADIKVQTLTAGNGDFEQQLVLANDGNRSVVQSGGRVF